MSRRAILALPALARLGYLAQLAANRREAPLAENESANAPVPVVGESDETEKTAAEAAHKTAAKSKKKAARLSEKSRRAIQQSDGSDAALARRFGRHHKTIAKWRARLGPKSLRMGPRTPMPRLLTAKEEVIIIAFRRRTRLALEDCLALLRPIIANLHRSQLHRCFTRYGLGAIGKTAAAPPVFAFGPPGPRSRYYARPNSIDGPTPGKRKTNSTIICCSS
jgi:transposase-like protein